MTITRKSANVMIAGFLALAVLGAGIIGYSARIQADTITPGFATAKVIMELTVPQETQLSVTANFTPTNPNVKKYYFKTRVFSLKPGINLVNWYIKKIPGGTYSTSLKSNLSAFDPALLNLSLTPDKVNDTNKFIINLGMPAASEEQVPEPTESVPSTDSSGLNSPPTPSLDMTATGSTTAVPQSTATERVPTEDIPSIPQFST